MTVNLPKTTKELLTYIENCERMFDFTGDPKYREEALKYLKEVNKQLNLPLTRGYRNENE